MCFDLQTMMIAWKTIHYVARTESVLMWTEVLSATVQWDLSTLKIEKLAKVSQRIS